MTIEDLLQIIKLHDETKSDTITKDSLLSDTSLSSFGLIVLLNDLDEKFGYTLDICTMSKIKTIEDFYNVLKPSKK